MDSADGLILSSVATSAPFTYYLFRTHADMRACGGVFDTMGPTAWSAEIRSATTQLTFKSLLETYLLRSAITLCNTHAHALSVYFCF